MEQKKKTASPYKVSFKVNTGRSGLKSVSVNGEDITDSDSFEVSENGKYVVVMTANNGLTTTKVITIDNIVAAERPVLYVTPVGTVGSETSNIVRFKLSSPNSSDDVVYYYNIGSGWVQMDGDTFVMSKAGDHKVSFKAVSGGLESYSSPEYSATLTTSYYRTVIKTTVLENQNSDEGTVSLAGVKVYVNDDLVGTTDSDGTVECYLKAGEYNILLDNGSFNRKKTINVAEDAELNMPMMALDLNKDGCVNAMDYAMIRRVKDTQLSILYNEIYMNFHNVSEDIFAYSD